MRGENKDALFYTLPVEQVEAGMSTDNGHTVTEVRQHAADGGVWFLEVEWPDGATTGSWPFLRGERVGLAVFSDTEVDGSAYPDAEPRTGEEVAASSAAVNRSGTRRARSAEELEAEFGTWGEYPDHPAADWTAEAAAGDTRLGYWAWVAATLSYAADAQEVRS